MLICDALPRHYRIGMYHGAVAHSYLILYVLLVYSIRNDALWSEPYKVDMNIYFQSIKILKVTMLVYLPYFVSSNIGLVNITPLSPIFLLWFILYVHYNIYVIIYFFHSPPQCSLSPPHSSLLPHLLPLQSHPRAGVLREPKILVLIKPAQEGPTLLKYWQTKVHNWIQPGFHDCTPTSAPVRVASTSMWRLTVPASLTCQLQGGMPQQRNQWGCTLIYHLWILLNWCTLLLLHWSQIVIRCAWANPFTFWSFEEHSHLSKIILALLECFKLADEHP